MSRRALVTGASEGIGRAVARELAGRGYAVTATARNGARLEELLGELPGAGHRMLVADLASPDGVHAVLEELAREHHEVLVNDAAFGAVGAFEEVPLDVQLAMIRVNVEALVALSHAFLRTARPGDALVNVSSIVGLMPHPTQPAYTATKAFVTSLTESLWVRQRRRGVHVLGVHPGATRTRFSERAGRPAGRHGSPLPAQSAEAVACELADALERRRGPIVVTGAWNRALALAARLVPRRLVLLVSDRVSR